MNGIDISANNGSVNWDQINPGEVGFAYIKATEGVGWKDPTVMINALGAQRRNLPFGYYHFASLKSVDVVSDASAEADAFSAAIFSLPESTLLPVLDIETNEINLSQESVALWIQTFLSRMKTKGYPDVMIYSGLNWLNVNLPDNHQFGNIPLWIAEYNSYLVPTLPKGWSKYNIWQYTDSGKVSGVAGVVDVSRSGGILETIKKKSGG